MNRAETVVSAMLDAIRGVIVEHDVTYEEYAIAKQWLMDVGEAGEWPLFLDVFVETTVERNAFRGRAGSAGTILGPYHLPDAPVLDAPFELPRRPDEQGEPLTLSGRVTDAEGTPLAGAVLDVWHADAEGFYSGFHPDLPPGIFRGKVIADAEGRYEVNTILPAPYTIPHEGPTGAMVAACEWHPWRPAHIHLIVDAPGHEPLITQLFFEGSDYLDGDVAGAVKEDLVVRPVGGRVEYDFALAPAEVPLAAA
ncbi:catechol 1,2-dioxygenase [Solirubrobacter sp. CPCC 204708]|uniref:Catechol 1,2-dioxygenase n=1 Tax=Solirubrobacter deserti TaxID=2282478 RepID=A0ABT4RVQ2_9ACTN|nr:dioxygenase [Solirubrobacter deserti]MBE2315946.1 catechol 1,2-dioxygenase [Solirubrobacter deserti]MDA0142330.1 catechol 1,2-dioxygenase [Solirubrobacter deserti]